MQDLIDILPALVCAGSQIRSAFDVLILRGLLADPALILLFRSALLISKMKLLGFISLIMYGFTWVFCGGFIFWLDYRRIGLCMELRGLARRVCCAERDRSNRALFTTHFPVTAKLC